MKGLHAFHFQSDYNSFAYSDPKNSELAAYFNMIAAMPGATHGTTLVGHALHCMTNTQRTDAELEAGLPPDEVVQLARQEPEISHVHKAWATLANLEVPFPEPSMTTQR